MADYLRLTVLGGAKLQAHFAGNAVAVNSFVDSNTRKYGQLLLTRVRAKASGRPGPRAQTGDYRRSITLTVTKTALGTQATVGTASPQARRLEFGFAPGIGPQQGVDVLGRQFHQQPLPHFGPALDEVFAAYKASTGAGIAAILAGGTAR